MSDRKAEKKPPDPPPPQRVAHYRLDALVARGGEGVVYRATDTTLDRTVALKIIDDPASAEGLIAEARHVSLLSHPCIAGVHQAGIDPKSGFAFIALEWVQGPTLRKRLRDGPLGIAELCRFGQRIASAVAHAHDKGLIHGDLKADNVVIAGAGDSVKLLDFGLSSTEGEIRKGDLWGTPAYMAPELLAGGPRDEATDLFALGVLLHEMATGVLPFGGEDGDDQGVRLRQAEGDAPPPRELRSDLPSTLSEIITTLLCRDPSARGPAAPEVERFFRLRVREERRGSRWLLPILGVLLLTLLGWVLRESFFPSRAGNDGPGAGAPESPPLVRVGRWTALGSRQEDPASRHGRDLLTLLLNGDDPGSAILVGSRYAGEGAVADEPGIVLLAGSWGRRRELGGGASWEARFQIPLAGGDRRRIEGDDPLDLARRVAEEILRERVANIPATTLCDAEGALSLFIDAVRESDGGDLREVRRRLAEARMRAGSFPEAAAWEAALLVIEGDLGEAAARVAPLRDLPSAPARILAATLAVPVRARAARWGEPHTAARLVDLSLDWHAPETPFSALEDALARDRHAGLPALPLMEAILHLEQRRPAEAAAAIERYRTFGASASTWRLLILDRWLLRSRGELDEAERETSLSLLALPPEEPAGFLRIPFFLSRGRIGTAVSLARECAVPLAIARQQVALTLALGGRFEDALAAARGIQIAFDLGAAERTVAAIEILRGDREGARKALLRARESDAAHPKTVFLLGWLEGEPYSFLPREAGPDAGAEAGREPEAGPEAEGAQEAEAGPEAEGAGEAEGGPGGEAEAGPVEPASRFERWRRLFESPAEGRRARLEGDPERGASLLASVRWVGEDLGVLEWPELGYLAWLERIACLHAQGGNAGKEAKKELGRFRDWWPRKRPPEARVSRVAEEVERFLEGSPAEKD